LVAGAEVELGSRSYDRDRQTWEWRAMSRPNRAAGIIALVVALLCAACGSRVADEVQESAGEMTVAADDGLGVVSSDDAGATADGPVDAGATAGAGTIGGGTATGAVGGARSGGTSSSPGAGAGGGGGAAETAGGGGSSRGAGGLTASAPGVTATEVKLGLVYDKSAGSANAALGFAGVGQIDQRRAYDAVIAYINKSGGIGGRKLVPVYHVLDSAGPDATAPPEVTQQKICTTFTENRVFGSLYNGTETMTRCLNENRIVRVSGGAVDEQLLAESPLLVILSVDLSRAARFSVDRFHARGFYAQPKPGTVPPLKFGLVRYDEPAFERAGAVLKRQLQAKGIATVEEAAVQRTQTVDQASDEIAGARNAALQFKSAGITHVQFLGTSNATLPLFFMQAAEKQLYRPRYGLISNDGGQALATLLGGDAQNQLAGSLQVGWFPIFDLHRSEYSGDKTSQAFRTCIEILSAAGEGFTEGDPTRNKEAIAALFCDNLFYFAKAATAAGPNLTPDSFMEGVRSIDGMDSAQTYHLSTSQRRDAFGGVKDAQWVDDCSCFRLVDPTVHRV
jgi:hypothetical protein